MIRAKEYARGKMNKIAQYLNEHIIGEVATDQATRKAFATDGSVLTITPDIVVHPRITNDIRKAARFSWQLADKGHLLPITPRGSGSDQTGAALGKGMIINTTAHMDTIFELDSRQRLVRLQPGVTFKTLNDALALHGLSVPSYPVSAPYDTIGGAIANNASGVLSGKYGSSTMWTHQLEIVLANGDVLQTGRLSKRDLNRKKGLQTFEGEIYRALDNVITDNQELIQNKIASDVRDNVGYGGLADVKLKDGSFDLAPLFAGSQGTLGIISEVIMKADMLPQQQTAVLAVFDSTDQARDAIDIITPHDPAVLEVIDGRIFENAKRRGKKYQFQSDSSEPIGAVVLAVFDDTSERAQKKKVKRLTKEFDKRNISLTVATDEPTRYELMGLLDVTYYALHPLNDELSAPPLFDGAYIPLERFEDFTKAVDQLAAKYGVELPLHGHALQGVFQTRAALNLAKVSDKQKVFKLLSEYSALVDRHGGHLIGQAAEGRLKAPFAYKYLDDDVIALFAEIKNIFDPLGILNPGVKQPGDLKELAKILRSEYDTSRFANYSQTN